MEIELQSVLTCPECGTTHLESMPTEYCQFFYRCSSCGETIRPKEGDCCVYCSYGSVRCPSMQAPNS